MPSTQCFHPAGALAVRSWKTLGVCICCGSEQFPEGPREAGAGTRAGKKRVNTGEEQLYMGTAEEEECVFGRTAGFLEEAASDGL